MATNWNKMTVPQLKQELQQRELEIKGTKADLVARLEKYDNEEEEVVEEADSKMETEQDIVDQIDAVTAENGEEKAEEKMDQDEEDTEVKPKEEEDKEGKEDKEDKEDKEGKEDKEEENKDDESKEEKKEEGPDYSLNATGFVIALDTGSKMVIPSKDTLKTDLQHHVQPKTVIVFPVGVDDLGSSVFQPFFERCIHFHVSFQEHNHEKDKSQKGYIEFVFASPEQATEQTELLSAIREDLQVKHLTVKDKKSDIIKEMPRGAVDSETLLKKYLYIGNLPPTATDQALQALFPDALRLCVIHNEDGLPKGYALAEMPTEEACDRAIKMYMKVAFEEHILVVMRAWQKVPKGLLDHYTRVDLLKKVKKNRIKLQQRFTDPFTRKKLDNENSMHKQRLDKDCKVREEVGLPSAPDVIRRDLILKEMEKKKEDTKEEKEKESEKKTPVKKFSPYKRPATAVTRGPRGRRGVGVPSLVRGRGSYSSHSNQGFNRSYQEEQRGTYSEAYDEGYSNESGRSSGHYGQAVEMLMQVSKMLGQGQGQQSQAASYANQGSYGGSGYGAGAGAGSGYSGASSGYGGSGYGGSASYGYSGMQNRKRQAEDDGFGGGKRGPGGRGGRGARW